MANAGLKERLEDVLGSRVVEDGSLAVGFGLTGLSAQLADGRKVAVKARAQGAHSDLTLEAYMLEEVRRHSALPVPRVLFAAPDLLVMDFIETDGGGITPSVERHAAELIAALHATPRHAPPSAMSATRLSDHCGRRTCHPSAGSSSSATIGCWPWQETRLRKAGCRRRS